MTSKLTNNVKIEIIDKTKLINKTKISCVKKNITIFKKDKPVKIKSTQILQKKTMDDALEANEVLLWGINKIDSITLNEYVKKKNIQLTQSTLNLPTNTTLQTLNSTYIPTNHYTIADLDFLNIEYDKIENKILKMTDLTEEYDELLDLQDSLTDLINELEYEAKNNSSNQINTEYIEENTNKINIDKVRTIDTNLNKVLLEVELKTTKTIKSTKSTKSTKLTKTTKSIKPYYFIGDVPEGYREATMEEAIYNRKVSLYGKKRVKRELNSLFEITGTIYIENIDNSQELNKKIMALKGKLNYYKKELEFQKESLESDTINVEKEKIISEKISEIKNCYKKTLDIYNLYVKKFQEIKQN